MGSVAACGRRNDSVFVEYRNGLHKEPEPVALDPNAELHDIDALMAKHRPAVLRYVSFMLKDADLVQTVTQDCFLRAFNSRMTFRGQCSVRTYLMVIARNLVRDHTRLPRFKFWQRAEGASVPLCEIENRIADDTKSAERSMLEEEALRLVWRAAAGLPEKQYAVFLLRFVEDMEVLEIAQATGLKVATVRSRLRSAVVLVRRRLPRSWKRFVA